MGRRATRSKAPEPSGSDDDEVSNNNEQVEEDEESTTVTLDSKSSKFTPCTKKLFIVPKELNGNDWSQVFAVRLPNPRTQLPTYFLIDTSKDKSEEMPKPFIYEILNFDPPCRSWFIDDQVCSDGNVRIVTSLDPLFLIIPAISKSSQAKPLEDHLYQILPEQVIEIFGQKIKPAQLAHVAEKRVSGDIVAYAYNPELTLAWLKKKVEKTVTFLKQKNLTGMESSISANFSASSTGTVEGNDQQYLEYACDIVGEYLEPSLKTQLLIKLGLPTESDRKRKSRIVEDADENTKNKKKHKGEQEVAVEPLENYSTMGLMDGNNGAGNTPKGAKAKALQKAAKGSQSLFKFFAPKS